MMYAYRCQKCKKEFQFDYPMGQAPETIGGECNADGNTTFKRIFTKPGVVFRGPGFHSTDYSHDPRRRQKGEYL